MKAKKKLFLTFPSPDYSLKLRIQQLKRLPIIFEKSGVRYLVHSTLIVIKFHVPEKSHFHDINF